MKIIIDSGIPFIQGVFEPYAEVVYIEGRSISCECVRDADALVVRTRTHCNRELLEDSAVRLVVTATIGTDHIDLDYCREHGIAVANAAGCNARGVLQWVSSVLVQIAADRGIAPHTLSLGIVGVGNVGSLVWEYAKAWGFNTICCDPPREEREHLGFSSIEEIFAKSDIVTLHTPLAPDTFHLVDDRLLSAWQGSDKILINASRGEVVDTQSLLRAGVECAIDVWEHEPDIDRALLSKAFISTPHIAGYSLQGKANATAMAVAAVARHFRFPLEEWYPSGVTPSAPRPISWEELCRSAIGCYDILSDSALLKKNPEQFEQLRNKYNYREERF